MQPSNKDQEDSEHRQTRQAPESADFSTQSDLRRGASGEDDADGSDPPLEETFVLDYDQEIIFLRSEGRLRAGIQPTGFREKRSEL